MNKLITPLAIFIISVCLVQAADKIAPEKKVADEIALKYCIQDFVGMGNAPGRSEALVHEKMYINRILELKDGKLNAYFAKDKIRNSVRMYERFIRTKKSWMNTDVTPEDEKRFLKSIKELNKDLGILEKSYPTDYKVFDKINSFLPKIDWELDFDSGKVKP